MELRVPKVWKGVLLLAVPLFLTYPQLYRLCTLSYKQLIFTSSNPSATVLKSDIPGHELFCESDPGLEHHISKSPNKTSRHTCFGVCKANREFSIHSESVVEAPHLLSLCQNNPFHGFYDCLFPLIHYLTNCRPDKPPVITRNGFIREEKKEEWATCAQQIFLQHSGVSERVVELAKLRKDECVCFQKVVKFPKKSFWRPIRFQYQQEFQGHKVLAPHPIMMKEKSLKKFRNTVLKFFNADSARHEASPQILVYDRKDADRRRWLNARSFITQLSNALVGEIKLKHMMNMPNSFKEQVLEHNRAGILIAPHGAGMVNTLFMREGSVVIEITSRYCMDETMGNETNLDVALNVSDANTWVPWHAQSLGLYHVGAPCMQQGGNGDFTTDNDAMINITFIALSLLRYSA